MKEDRIIKNLISIGAVKKGKFKLSSGKESDIYVDLRLVPSHPSVFQMIVEHLFLEFYGLLRKRSALVGVATGGIPWATALAYRAGLPSGYVRQRHKEYGLSRIIELDERVAESVILVDDVTTTGKSLAIAIEILREEGVFVDTALVIVDRNEGARDLLREKGVRLNSLLSLDDIRRLLEGLEH
ncbi:MAG: orotate phosphoribosyltransferase [Desulfurococcales archaeon]|nr:orotate phosphoribosyltransferase [Desulfurococcales archaeon]